MRFGEVEMLKLMVVFGLKFDKNKKNGDLG